MPKENRRTQMTKLLLRTALIELMQEKPFRQITIKDLCERADLNRTTFYLHYTNQEAVLADVERDALEKTMEYMKNISPTVETVELIQAFLSYVKNNAPLFRILLCHSGNDAIMASYMGSVLGRLRPNLPMYGPPERERYVLNFLMHGSIHVIIMWMEQGFNPSENEIAALIYRMCDGVSLAVGEK